MSAVAAAIGGAAVLGGGAMSYFGAKEQAGAARDAANTQAGAARYAADLQDREFQQQQENQRPWLNAGVEALGGMRDPEFQKHVTNDDIMAYMDPSYQFRLKQGQDALEASAAARGQQFSGNTLKALTDYGQESASTEYGNAYNRFYNDQNTRFNRLASLAGVGQTAVGQLGQAGQNYANNAGAAAMGGANAMAAGRIGAANAWAGGMSGIGNAISGGANNWMGYSMMNRMLDKNNGGGQGQFSNAAYQNAANSTVDEIYAP